MYEWRGSYSYSGKSGRDPTPTTWVKLGGILHHYSGVRSFPVSQVGLKCNVPTLLFIWVPNVGDIDFKVVSTIENSNKFQKN